MDNLSEQFKVNLNQNLWGLVIGLATLGSAEYFKLCTLYLFGVAASGIMLLSVIFTTYAYTVRYCKNKKGGN